MIINEKMLCIPPYLSTSWRQITSLHLDIEKTLHVSLKNGMSVAIPGLNADILNHIFSTHAQFVSHEPEMKLPLFNNDNFANPLPFNIDPNLLDMTSHFLHHDSEKADSPDIPDEIIKKLSVVASKIGPIDIEKLPESEPHCNCPHCQIVRAIKNAALAQQETATLEEEISDEDLRFSDWQIVQTDNNLYQVTNPLDNNEKYTVYLGDPVGCTCGSCGCEHIKAVLRS